MNIKLLTMALKYAKTNKWTGFSWYKLYSYTREPRLACGGPIRVENDEIVGFYHNRVPDNAQVERKPKGINLYYYETRFTNLSSYNISLANNLRTNNIIVVFEQLLPEN